MSNDASGAAAKRLLGATAVMAAGTFLSRILGFVRTMLVAFALGNVTAQGDIFTLATVVPNNLYMIFAGGALNTVLVPQIVRHTRHDDDGGEAYVNRVMTAFLLALGAVTALALVFTPQVMGVWMGDAWQAGHLAGHRDALFFLAYLTMPQLFFYGVFFLVGQVLNARDKFGPMMWAPIVNNVVQIAVLGAYAVTWADSADRSQPFTTEQMLVLGIGSTAGIILQTVALIPFARSVGFRYRPRFDLRGVGLGETFHLAKWAIGYVLLTQLAAVVVTRLASSATIVDPAKPGPGLLTYNEAYLTWILPHSLVTVSLATALLPSASRLAAAGDLAGVGEETARTLRLANTFAVPATVGFLTLAYPFANLVFGNGAGAADWHAVALTLMMFAVGLVPYTVQYVYLRGFYALEDMRAAFLLQIWISGANAAAALAWVTLDPNPLTVAPRLALCYSLSYVLGALLTYRSLARRVPSLEPGPMLGHLLRVLLASLPGGAVAWWLTGRVADSGRGTIALAFLASVALIIGLYVPLARLLRVEEVTQILALLGRRLGRGRRADAAARPAAPADDDEGLAIAEALAADAEDTARTPLLAYPKPESAEGLAAQPGDSVRAGDILDERFALERLLSRRGSTLTWLARDLTLSRPVLLHVLPPDEPRTLEILDEARRAAPTTDSRFLKVFDVVLAEGKPYGSYIVCEYAPGQSLELVLRQGPLSQAEACWVVLQVAEGLGHMHALGLHHRHLNPDTIVVTASGNVKIVGFLLEAALAPEPAGPDGSTESGERSDVLALGQVLYASLVGRWPGAAAYGLPAAPTDTRGRPLPARQVLGGLSPQISEIVDRILNPDAVPWRHPLLSVDLVALALREVVGGVDASHDLDRRLAFPVPPVGLARPAAPLGTRTPQVTAALGAAPAASGPVEDSLPLGATAPYAFDPDADDPGTETPPVAPVTPVTPFSPASPSQADIRPTRGAAAPPPNRPPVRDAADEPVGSEPGRIWLLVVAVMLAVALVIGIVGVFVNQYNASRSVPGRTPAAIAGVRDFDPSADGGDDSENGPQARLAVDGDAATAWLSERYGRSADFNGRKPGVGLLVDLGAEQRVGTVRVQVAGTTDLELRVPVDPAAAPSLATARDWRVVASAPGSAGEATFTLTEPVRTRYLLVYVTRLPPLTGGGFQAAIHEIGVTS
nr:murein biosynthesis integral membrane protein MurJ [Propionibacterium sp.]